MFLECVQNIFKTPTDLGVFSTISGLPVKMVPTSTNFFLIYFISQKTLMSFPTEKKHDIAVTLPYFEDHCMHMYR